MPKCVYCGKEYDIHRGVTIVTNKGTINYLCSSKCRKNMAMKRRKVRWVDKAEMTKEEQIEAIKKAEEEKEEKAVIVPEANGKK